MPEELHVIGGIHPNKMESGSSSLMTKTGTYKKLSVVTSLVGIGKVFTAINTQKLVSQFTPKAIIFTGVARDGGGTGKESIYLCRFEFQVPINRKLSVMSVFNSGRYFCM